MKKFMLLMMTLLLVIGAAGLVLADKGIKSTFEAKAGDTIFVCGCGAGCDCGSLAKKAGKCGCGKEMVKSTVTRIDKDKVYYKLEGKELSAPVTGKYACGCGAGCNCGSISQKPGKCGCGKEMVKVSAKK